MLSPLLQSPLFVLYVPSYVVDFPLCVFVPVPACLVVGVQGGVEGVGRTGYVVVVVHFGMLVERG